MISQSERDWIESEMREKRRRDLINREKLIYEGGFDWGVRRGMLIGQIQAIQDGLHETVTPTAELRHCSFEQLELTLEACQRRLQERFHGQDPG